MSRAEHTNEDRRHVPAWMLGALAVANGYLVGAAAAAFARDGARSTGAFLAGFGVAMLAMFGLPSVSLRLISRVVLITSAAVLIRLGVLSDGVASGGQTILLWLVAAVTSLVVTEAVAGAAEPPLGGDRGRASTAQPGSTARRVALVSGAVIVAALLLSPLLVPLYSSASQAGEGPSLDALEGDASALRSSDSMDMTTRPDLSDDVVFTVDTDFATFWRVETYDVWDGRTWTRSDSSLDVVVDEQNLPTSPEDLGARGDDLIEQRIRLETSYSDVIVAAPSPVAVEAPRLLQSRPDGTLVTAPLGRGATYTVTSRREPLSVERLQEVDDQETPEAVLEQYAAPPVTTDRVRELATEITAGTSTRFEAIEALQDWMGDRVEYSLDAPLAPKGVDVVDNFLFDAEQGWCEQIASSLVVLARANGIPARLVNGYVPADQDPVTGVFTVREREAHAWAEVWFPEVGWVPFDPTANVPLAGEDATEPTLVEWIKGNLVALVLIAVAIGLAVGPLRIWIRRRWARRAQRPTGWEAQVEAELDLLGAKVGRPRGSWETAAVYASELAERYRDPRLGWIGALLDDERYAATPVSAEARGEVDAVLRELSESPVPELVGAET